MIKYRVNNKFVEEEAFYIALKKDYESMPHTITYEECLECLTTQGCVRLSVKRYYFSYFYMADEEVFELEQIVAENEYDPLDDDAFAVAFAIFQKGFRRN